jgi:hypothetical protein
LRWLSETEHYWGGSVSAVLYYYHFLQTQDIDATETMHWNHGRGFRAIGNTWNVTIGGHFRGVYDGNNHKVSNLYINGTALPQDQLFSVSFFGGIQDATLRNIKLENVNFKGDLNRRGLSSLVNLAYYSTIYNCSASGVIIFDHDSVNTDRGFSAIAGLVFLSMDSLIENCFSEITVYQIGVPEHTLHLSGLINLLYYSTMKNSYFFNRMNNLENLQIIGLCNTIVSSTISNSFVTSAYTIPDESFLVRTMHAFGSDYETYIKSAVWNTEKSGISEPVFVYWCVCGNECEDDTSLHIVNSHGLSTDEMKQAETYIALGWDFDNVWDIDPNVNDGYPFLRSSVRPSILSNVDNTQIPIPHYISVYPNPVRTNSQATFEISVKDDQRATLQIFNIRGQLVREFVNLGAGNHKVIWDQKDNNNREVGTGIYFYRITSPSADEVKRMVIIR